MREAVFTVSPKRQYLGIAWPTTPAIYTRCLKTKCDYAPQTNVPSSGHHHAADEEVIAGRQQAQEQQTGVQSVLSLEGH